MSGPGFEFMPVVDQAADHIGAFVFMGILTLIFGAGKVAKETKRPVRFKSFLNFWMMAYLIVLSALTSVTTAMALVLLIDEKGHPRVNFIPPSFLSMAAAVVGVFGFEFLARKFIIGFGENQLDFGTTLQNLVDQAVESTLRREASA